MRALASTTWVCRCWITLVILSLARLPLPIPDLPTSGLVAYDAASATAPDDETSGHPGRTWHWRWVTLSPGSPCSIAGPCGPASTENDAEVDCDACEAEVEYLPTGRSRSIATPFADRAFDATPIAPLDGPTGPAVASWHRSFAASFSPDIPRAALLQRWIC